MASWNLCLMDRGGVMGTPPLRACWTCCWHTLEPGTCNDLTEQRVCFKRSDSWNEAFPSLLSSKESPESKVWWIATNWAEPCSVHTPGWGDSSLNSAWPSIHNALARVVWNQLSVSSSHSHLPPHFVPSPSRPSPHAPGDLCQVPLNTMALVSDTWGQAAKQGGLAELSSGEIDNKPPTSL